MKAVGALANCDAADEDSPSRDFDDSLYEPLGNKRTSGSLDTNNSNAETGMKGEGELAYQVDAEGEGSGSNPTGELTLPRLVAMPCSSTAHPEMARTAGPDGQGPLVGVWM